MTPVTLNQQKFKTRHPNKDTRKVPIPPPYSATRRTAISAGAAATLLSSGCTIEKLSYLSAADSHPLGYPTVQAVESMGKELALKTNGRLNIKMYAGGQLGTEQATLEITSFGGLDISRVFIAPLNSIEPTTIIPALPFLFRSTNHMRATLDGPVGEEILASLQPHNLIGLCFYDSGARSFYNTQKPIKSPDDFMGLKIRVPNSDLYVSMINALGANATPMPITEVYQALIQGVIDGAENNWPSYSNGRHFEVAPYFSLTRHMMAPEVLVMSANSWKKLSDDDKVLIKQAAKNSVQFMRSIWEERVDQAKKIIAASKVVTNDVSNISDFQELMAPVWEKFVSTSKLEELLNTTMDIGKGGLK